ncbi:MAG: SDR family NAD(P)-dependent oxidoreductase [Myxococcales bacterium]|nr:MAG: SDR family NAD(P)-dependent oxidoreductase [Myxococcales bacterium]
MTQGNTKAQRILVTGANKGIGLAIVEAILQRADTVVILGSRDLERGNAAVQRLVTTKPEWRDRLVAVALDVTSDASVASARDRVLESSAGEELYGLVNNAGIASGDLATILETNLLGMQRVCAAFVPHLRPAGGRVVNVTSAAGPSFVANCSPEQQRFFLNPDLTWAELLAFTDRCRKLSGPTELAAAGLGDGAPYGLSKACANTYTLILAREQQSLVVNACTPGFIATDMTRHFVDSQQKSPEELGMKAPAEGAKAPLHLLFGELAGSGRYYGSDAKRSPLDRYRAPGSPEYSGD